jgi:hypothetical protein
VASADTSVGAALAAWSAWAAKIGDSTNAVAPSSTTSVTAAGTLDAHSAVAASAQAGHDAEDCEFLMRFAFAGLFADELWCGTSGTPHPRRFVTSTAVG